MKRYFTRILWIFIILLSTGGCYAQLDSVQHVILIGVDALSPDAIQKAKTPFMNSLILNGASTMHARGVFPTKSSPNWASMILGAGPEQHGITSNDWELDLTNISPTVADSQGYFPSIFTVLRNLKGKDFKMGVFHHWKGYARLFNNDNVNSIKHGETVDETIAFATQFIKNERPQFTFIHLDELDHTGHKYGHGTAQYYKEVEATDVAIGKVITALKEIGIFNQSIIIVTSDHGGLGKDHGEETMSQLEIPWVISGPKVVQNKRIDVPVNIYDTASTIAYIFGCEQPYAWISRPVLAAFSNDGNNLFYQYVAKPKITPLQLKYITNKTAVYLFSDTPRAELRYTIDGSKPTSHSSLYKDSLIVNSSMLIRTKAFLGNSLSDEESLSLNYRSDSTAKNVHYTYYEGDILDWNEIEDLKIAHEGTLFGLDLNEVPHKEKNYVIKYNAEFKVDTPGVYKFSAISYGWTLLKINNKPVIDEKTHHMSSRLGIIDLKKGVHELEFIYYSYKSKIQPFELLYKGPDFIEQKLPISVFRPLK
ncbi:MAG: alkaline phosphatase family protein [Flavobacteriaceae bacterium]